MLLTSWLARLSRTFARTLHVNSRRPASRRFSATLRRLACTQVESLEDRSLLSAIGVSIDAAGHRLLVFNAETGAQTGVVDIPNGTQHSDTVISPDGNFAYVSSFQSRQIHVVDLNTMTLASGTNPIQVATEAEDLVITPDGKYLLVVDGGNVNPIVVVDTATRATVSVLDEGIGHSAVDVTASGVVLVGSINSGTTRQYLIDSAGQLTFTGQSIPNGGQNVTIAPDGVTAVEVTYSQLTSFSVSTLSPIMSVTPGPNVQSVIFSPDGTKLYVRTGTEVLGYHYDPATGTIGSVFFNANGLAPSSLFYGTDQLDITPDGTRLYASSGSLILAYDALSSEFLGSLNLPDAYFVGVDVIAPSGVGAVSGTKFNDLDSDGVRDANEPGLAGWVIYADLDNDRTLDASEPFATTASDGTYTLPLDSGAYTLHEVPQAGWIQTSPQPGLFVTGNNGSSLATINPLTGTGSVIGPFGRSITSTYAGAFTPDGTFWTFANAFDSSRDQLAQVNIATGAVTLIGVPTWTGSPIIALEADADGNLFGAALNGFFVSINKSNGQVTAIGHMGIDNIKDLTYDTNGNLWAAANNRLYRVNSATGSAVAGPAFSGTNAEVQSIMVDPLTGTFYAATYTGNTEFYSVNVTTGATTLVGSSVGVSAVTGGDFMPLSVNRGLSVIVSANQTATGRDFGNIADMGSVNGTKFHDLDLDGTRDEGEPGLPGWVIYADLDNDNNLDVNEPFTTTGPDGTYTLAVASGSYTIREQAQAGWVQTSPVGGLFSTGNNGTALISINPVTGAGSFVGPFGANNPQTYAGAFTPDGTFWTVSNASSTAAARLSKVNLATGALTVVGTPNSNGAPIFALESDAAGNLYAGNFNGLLYSVNKSTGQLTAIGNTTAQGLRDFAFDDQGTLWAVAGGRLFKVNPLTGASTPGPAITGANAEVMGIMVDPLTGTFYATTYTGSSRLYTIDVTTGAATPTGPGLGISAPVGGDFLPLSVNRGQTVTVNAGKATSDHDFGNIPNQGTVTGTKFNDLDGDGSRDVGEPGLSGWVIYADLDNDSARDTNEPTAVTGADGTYTLTIASGSYTIREEMQAGWIQTSPTGGLYSTGNNGTALITVNTATGTGTFVGPFGANFPTTYAGAFTPDGTFWTINNAFDSSLSSLSKVNLATGALTTIGGPNWSGSPIIALEADAAGNLYAGNFNGTLYSVNKANGVLTPIGNMGISAVRDFTFDNEGTLWAVANSRLHRINSANGAAAPGPQLTGVNAEVQGIMVDPLTGVFYATTYTGSSQLYTVNPATGVATPVGQGLGIPTPNGGDFMPLSANRGHSVTISSGKTAIARDFGNIADVGTVAGTKYNDLDGDGTQDANEPGLSGWVIYADLDNDSIRDVDEPFTTTDSNGDYTLSLASGVYSIREELQAGWTQTSPLPGLFATGNNRLNMISINPATGTGSVLGPTGLIFNEFGAETVHGGTVGPDGTFWTIIDAFNSSTARLGKGNLVTGAVASVGTPNWSGSPITALEVDSSGNLFGMNLAGSLFSIDQTTGQLTPISQTGFTNIWDITFDNDGALWAVSSNRLLKLDPTTGATIPGPSIAGVNGEIQGIMVDPLTGVFYAMSSTFTSNSSRLYSVDLTTGVATPLGVGIGVSLPNGGDFTPLTVNRPQQVTVGVRQTTVDRDFGNVGPNSSPVITSAATASVPENSTAVIQVTAVDPDSPAQSITYSIAGGLDADKFTINPVSGALSFTAVPNYEVPTDADGDNVYHVTVQATDSGTPALSATQAISVTIDDVNETPAIISDGAASVVENTTAVLTVVVNDEDAPAQAITFSIAGGDDGHLFTIDPVTGALTFISAPDFESPADTDGNNVYDVVVRATDNGTPELSTTQSIAVTVTDLPTALVSVMQVNVGEEAGANGKFRVSQSLVSTIDTTVTYSLSGTAFAGADYSALTGTVVIPAGQTFADIDVTVLNDALVEGNESVVVTLTGLGGHGPETSLDSAPGNLTASINIADNDLSTLSITNVTVTEGNAGTTAMTFTVTSSHAVPGGFTVAFNVAGLTAFANDYTVATTSPLSFSGAAGETRTITINVIGDVNSEATEALAVTLGTVTPTSPYVVDRIVTGAVGTGTITNDDTVTFTIGNVTATESAGTLVFSITADKPFDADTTLTFSVTSGSASGGADYIATSQQVTFLAGQTSKTVSVGLINDTIVEGTETFTVALIPDSPLNGRLVNVSDTGTGTITDNDSATVSITKINDGAETNSPVPGTFRITQSAASSTDTVVTYSIAGTATAGAAGDYVPLTGSVTIPAGQINVDIAVAVLNDATIEAAETVVVTLTGFTARDPEIALNSVSANRTATVSISDNDTPTFTSAAIASVPENTSTSTVVLDANVNTSQLGGHTVTFSLSGPDAGAFFINASTGQITFRASPNYENPADQDDDNNYQITIIATVNTSPTRSASQNVTISVTPVNDFTPVFVNSAPSFSLPENSATGTVVGSVAATDGDSPAQPLTYSIVSGNSSGAFTINPLTGQITVDNAVPLNFEITKRFTLTVRVTDNGTPTPRTANATVTVNLTNVAEPPTIVIPTPTGTYDFGSPNEFIAPDGSFNYGDVTNPSFNGAKLTVSISAGRLTGDILSIISLGTGSNQINTRNGNKLYYGSTQIGTFAGGSGNSPNLVITLNSKATITSVTQLIQRLSIKTSGAVGSTRTTRLQLTDISNVDSNIATRNITVVN